MSERFLDAKLCEIEINGMKNVLHGELVFQNINGLIRNSEEGYRYNHVTGMYGNNGSGKSTVVQTMSFLRDLIAKDYFLPEGRKKRLASQHRLLINAKKNMTENRFLVFLKKEAEAVFLEYSVRIEKCGEQYLVSHEKVRRKAKEEGKSWCSASNSVSRKRQIFLYTSGRETHFILSGLALFWLQKHFILFLSVQKKPSCQKRLLINNFLCSRILSGILFPLYMPGSSCSSFPALF